MRKTEYKIFLQEFEKIYFDIEDFTFVNDEMVTVITFKRQPKLIFRLNRHPSDFAHFQYYLTLYLPQYTHKRNAPDQWLSIPQISVALRDWIVKHVNEYIKEENLPDPLEELLKQRASMFGDSRDQTNLTESEKALYKQSIDTFETQLLEKFKLDEEHKEFVKEELKYLKGAVDRLNKRDLQSVALKIIHSIGTNIAATLVVEGAKMATDIHIPPVYWEIVKQAFRIVEQLAQ